MPFAPYRLRAHPPVLPRVCRGHTTRTPFARAGRGVALLLAFVAALAACGPATQTMRTGATPSPTPLGSGSTVYAGADGVYALRGSDGAQLWHSAAWSSAYLAPFTGDGSLYVGADGAIEALDARTGTVRWSHVLDPKGNPVHPLAAGSVAYATTCATTGTSGSVYAFRTTDGAPLWRFDTDGCIANPLTLADGALYVTANNVRRQLYALRASDGTLLWRLPLSTAPHASPVVAGGRVYIGSQVAVGRPDGATRTNILLALRAQDGAEVWHYQASVETPAGQRSEDILEPVALAGDVIYVAEAGGALAALGAADGALRWHVQLDHLGLAGIGSPPLVRGDTLFVEAVDDAGHGTLVALGTADGALRWRIALAAFPTTRIGPAHLAMGAGLLIAESCSCAPLVTEAPGFVEAFNPANGAPRWQARTATLVLNTTVGTP